MINLLLINKLCLIFPLVGCLTWILAMRRVAHLGRLAQALPGMRFAAPIMLDQAPLDVREPRMRRDELRLRDNPQSKKPVIKRHRVLIVGSGDVGQTLARSLEATGKYLVIGFTDDPEEADPLSRWPILGHRGETAQLALEFLADEVIVAYAPTWQQTLTNELALKTPNVSVKIVPSFYETLLRVEDVESHGDIALVRLTTFKSRDLIKRVSDTLVAFFGLLLLAPLMAAVAALIKMTSPGPALFSQERVGRFGRTFYVHKFRTMVADAEARSGPILANGTKDARLTPLGKWLRLFRFDELPQLWNVLRGEMSLVGPRPERPVFVDKFLETVPAYAQRHLVRPGITGLAQVCGGYHTDARDKLRFDLIYVSHRSVWLDLSILLRTVLVVVLPNPQIAKKEGVKC